MTRRLFTMLTILFCTKVLFSRGACIDQSTDLTSAEKSFKDELFEAEVAAGAIATFPPVEVSEGSFASTRVVIPVARAIRSRTAPDKRKKRHVAVDDRPTSGFVTRTAASKNGKTPRLRDHVTRKHGKHRRRNRCKKRFGCLRLGNHRNKKLRKNGNGRRKEIEEAKTTMEPRKWFEHQPRGNRNSEGQVLVGNRPLALFRQQLAAAAAVNVTRATTASTSTATNGRSTGTDSKKLDLSTDTKIRHIQTSAKLQAKVSTKGRNKITNGTPTGHSVDKASTGPKTSHVEENGNAAVTLTSEDSGKRNAELKTHERLVTFGEEHPALTIVVKRVPRMKNINAK